MELSHQKQSRPVPVTSLSFPYGDFNNFVVGSEEGTIYTGNIENIFKLNLQLIETYKIIF